jgi:putative ABC transport system substrate-binding protein
MSPKDGKYTRLTRLAMRVLKVIHVALVFFLTIAALPGTALSSGLVVLYPEVDRPYDKIYQDIISGIEEASEDNVNTLAIAPKESLASYRSTLNNFDPDNVIALGARSMTLMRELNLELNQPLPVVVGAVTDQNMTVSGISMVPDTRLIIDKLILLYSGVRNIHLVINTENRPELIKQADDYTKTKNLGFIVHHASTVQQAAGEYKKLLANIQEHDAIWLIYDKTINDSSLLSEILETAWKKKVAVFSSNPTHVKRGALFSIYPNNKKLGISLANLAKDSKNSSGDPKTLSPLRDVYTIVNDRTRRHLGISFSGTQRSEIDSIL